MRESASRPPDAKLDRVKSASLAHLVALIADSSSSEFRSTWSNSTGDYTASRWTGHS